MLEKIPTLELSPLGGVTAVMWCYLPGRSSSHHITLIVTTLSRLQMLRLLGASESLAAPQTTINHTCAVYGPIRSRNPIRIVPSRRAAAASV